MFSFDPFFDARVTAGTTQSDVDFSLASKEQPYTTAQKRYASAHFDFSLESLYSVSQVHGNDLIIIKEGEDLPERYLAADGILTDQVGLPIAIRTADCVPVFIFDPEQNCGGVIHAGWRGTYEKILSKAVQALCDEFNADPGAVQVMIGPCIRSCCYAVGEEFLDYFPGSVENRSGWYLDLVHANIQQVSELGVLQEEIKDCHLCTCCDQSLFSYRREGDRAGRMLSFMMIN